MDAEERKNRMKFLLERQNAKNKKTIYSALFENCLNALGNEVIILSQEKTEEIYRSFEREYPFTLYGRIDWEQQHFQKTNIEELIRSHKDSEDRCLII